MSRQAIVERLVGLRELAAMRGVTRSTLFRSLRALAASDVREHGQCDWLVRFGTQRKLWVNLSRLKNAHPGLFAATYVTREDFEGLTERVDELEEGQREQRKKTNALAGAVREMRATAKR